MALDESSNGDGSSLKHRHPEHFPHGPQPTALDPRAAISSVESRGTSYHHLPVELLACILNILFPDTGGRSNEDMTEIYRLRLVSKSWKELVEHTPGLWTDVSNHFPTVVVRDCLRWSKDRLLWIRIRGIRPTRMENLFEFLDLLQPHSHRWNGLEYFATIIGGRVSPRIRNFLESPAPMLQSIEVSLGEFDEKPGLNLAGGVAKELKHVTLRDASLPEYSHFLHGLETFSFKNNGTVSTREILNLFVENTALRRFELLCEGAEGESDPAASATQQLEIVANSLEQAIILTDHPQIITQILSQVSMPYCKYLELSADFMEFDNDLQVLDQAVVQFTPRIRRALSLGGRTRLTIESEYHYVWSSSLEDEGFRFCFEWTSISLGTLREWIRGLIGAVESPLELEIILSTLSRDIVPALGEWNELDVTKLTIHSSSEEMDEVVSLPGFLGDVMVDSIGALSWRFPNLRELDLSYAECELSEIFGMLNQRYLPDTYLREMEGLGISIQPPAPIDLRVQDITEVGDAALVTALKWHWGVKSLQQGEPDT